MVTIITQSEKVNGLSPGSLYFYNKHSGAGVGGSGGGLKVEHSVQIRFFFVPFHISVVIYFLTLTVTKNEFLHCLRNKKVSSNPSNQGKVIFFLDISPVFMMPDEKTVSCRQLVLKEKITVRSRDHRTPTCVREGSF